MLHSPAMLARGFPFPCLLTDCIGRVAFMRIDRIDIDNFAGLFTASFVFRRGLTLLVG